MNRLWLLENAYEWTLHVIHSTPCSTLSLSHRLVDPTRHILPFLSPTSTRCGPGLRAATGHRVRGLYDGEKLPRANAGPLARRG